MGTVKRLANGALALACALAWTASSAADQPDYSEEPDEPGVFSDVELALDFGVTDRGTTGIGGPLLGYGYDHEGGPVAGVGARLYFDADNDFFRHGVNLRLSHTAGGSFGLLSGRGFDYTQLDLTYAFRTELPCISDDDLRFTLTGLLGLTGARADASTGRGAPDDRWNQRVAAASALDHRALGGVLGVGFDAHIGALMLGGVLDLREQLGLGDTPAARSFLATATLRAGVDLEL